MNRREQAAALRADTQAHYNCCQSVLIPFCQECGISEEEALKLGSHFGNGMKHASTCGAVTAALMVLGLAGKNGDAASELLRRFREKNRALDCGSLLRIAKENGEERKPHCDRMVFDAVELLEELMQK